MQGRLSKPSTGKIQEFPEATWEKEFELASKIGLKIIEWTLDYTNFKFNPLFNHKSQDKLNLVKNKYSVNVPSITLDCFVEAPFYKRNELTGMESNIEDFIWILKNLAPEDVKILVLPIVAESGTFEKNHLESLVKCLTTIEDVLAISKKKIALECEFDLESIGILLNKLNPEYFGINFDMGNSAALGHNPKEEFDVYNHRILNIHIKDRVLNGPSVELGQGAVNFKEIAELIRNQPYLGDMILQAARNPNVEESDLIVSYLDFCKNFGWVV
jgi:hexulose-6-phosphate isomerase